MLHKKMLLAISKADMLDEELKEALKKDLPEGVDAVFISAVTGLGLSELKDRLWQALN
jgi:GTP-binding protein